MRLALAQAALTLALAPFCSAASAPAPPAPSEPLLWPSTQALTLPAVLDHLALIDRELTTLTARFTQTLTMAETGITQVSEGTVSFRKPESLRVEHVRPERQTVTVSSGEIWVWRPSQNQAIHGRLADWKKADPLIENLLQLGGYRRMLDSYDVSLDTPAAMLVLKPKSGGEDSFTLTLALAPRTMFPAVTELTAGAMRVRTALSETRFNPALPETAFRFEPPKGADVFRDFKPPRVN